ncbi:hypothetical protein I0C86_03055 [Plantactinospora sp. S1510]|uniref:Uncharacterized protein n=1 Tax=Plantactinospora alkalitolerans TaxID=2789879 RepID=A0ABS0GP94_9ACTN|nr:hypothetical protein [Plantactinospora alkalitolerans]MBF9127980.1 hypothetical protein [Plantactinospora alkalitolerans]
MSAVDIIPGVGVALARIGETRAEVEARVGLPVHGPGSNKAVYDTTPGLVISYTPADTVEIVEIAYSGDGAEEVFFDGVQLTFRFLDDVVADLTAKGYTSTPYDIGYEFHAGFAVWSMHSRWALDLDPEADEDDERAVSEGVSVAPYTYFTEG